MKYSIKSNEIVFDEHYQILKATVNFDSFSGDPIQATRYAFHRGDSTAILLYETDTRSLLLTRQFRYPTTFHEDGFIYEIPAGSLEAEEVPETCIIRETMEETGYRIDNPKKIACCYASPGSSTERFHIFYAEVISDDKVGAGGGIDSEKEDIQVIRVPVSDLDSLLQARHEAGIRDAKSLLALQWFKIHITP